MQIIDQGIQPLREVVATREITPFIGIYDLMSASIAARHYDSLFISGFGFAASHYGLPDVGFIAWPDIVAFVQRVRTVLPSHHLLVDIDDGYCDVEVAAHVTRLLEAIGASGVVLEDQRRPRRCGHVDGKVLMEVDDYVAKLRRVLNARHDLFVIARTDASDTEDILRRVEAYADAGADAILVDGIRDLNILKRVSERVDLPVAFNQIAGGKSPSCSLSELRVAGAKIVIYSTPCLFAAQKAVDEALIDLQERKGRLPDLNNGSIGVHECTSILNSNMVRRNGTC